MRRKRIGWWIGIGFSWTLAVPVLGIRLFVVFISKQTS